MRKRRRILSILLSLILVMSVAFGGFTSCTVGRRNNTEQNGNGNGNGNGGDNGGNNGNGNGGGNGGNNGNGNGGDNGNGDGGDNGGDNGGGDTPDPITVTEEIPLAAGYEFDYDNYFFDGFDNGVSYDTWAVARQAWGGDNGGVIPQNVSYTEDGVLLLEAHGYYYSGGTPGINRPDGTKTGSALISRGQFGYGRYEIRMKPINRLGACTAFWTYANFPSLSGGMNENHEIDFEFPVYYDGGLGYQGVQTTNWLTEVDRTTNVAVTPTPANDGEWHRYTFDWLPDAVIYYVDGVEYTRKDTHVPFNSCRLWLGVWFPVGWTGEPFFDTDYMQVDWVYHIPLLDEEIGGRYADLGGSAPRSEYPIRPMAMRPVNIIPNGDFEYLPRGGGFDNNNIHNAWTTDYLNGALATRAAEFSTDPAYVKDGVRSLVLKDGMFASTYIDSVYKDFTYSFEFDAKLLSGAARVHFIFSTDSTLETQRNTIQVTSGDWTQYSGTFTAPEGTRRIRIRIDSDIGGGEIAIDNITANYLGMAKA